MKTPALTFDSKPVLGIQWEISGLLALYANTRNGVGISSRMEVVTE